MSILYYKKDFLRHVQVGRQDWQASLFGHACSLDMALKFYKLDSYYRDAYPKSSPSVIFSKNL